VYGAADLAFMTVPSPERNRGVPFDEVEAWDALQGEYYNNVK
jgi:hypothetical protein